MAEKRKALIEDGYNWRKKITQLLYRPFDLRWVFYHVDAIDFGRPNVMQHMLAGENLALVLPKRVETEMPWMHALCSSYIADHVCVSLKTIDYFFPLYLLPEKQHRRRREWMNLMLFESPADYSTRRPNIAPDLLGMLGRAFRKPPAPEQVFHYVYAVLYSPPYREKYTEFLRSDFPRIPFPADIRVFRKMAALGEELAELHLLKSRRLDKAPPRLTGEGDNRVEKASTGSIRYNAKARRVYINLEQYFEGIPEDVWSYRIGGYQVLDKWLKDRVERRLSATDIKHYCRVATALSETMKLQKELADLYLKVEKKLITK